MGDHYVPQYYLKGFSQNNGKSIWVYDKEEGIKFPAQVKSIANITGFYSSDVEQYLANTIEGPANTVLMKIRQFEQIDQKDKEILSEYMAVMIKRVPKGLQRLEEMAPSISQKLFVDLSGLTMPEKKEVAQRRIKEIETILEKYSKDPPKEIWLENIPSERSPKVVAALNGMIWRFLVSKPESEFLTSDNPLFFFTGIGIGKPISEVLFPIAKNIALWATWKTHLPEGFINTTSQAVKEMNRRTTSYATRYVFKSKDEDWVLPFAIKGSWKLHLYQ
jgi:predicted DNA-binding transcriptional regulator AlpA